MRPKFIYIKVALEANGLAKVVDVFYQTPSFPAAMTSWEVSNQHVYSIPYDQMSEFRKGSTVLFSDVVEVGLNFADSLLGQYRHSEEDFLVEEMEERFDRDHYDDYVFWGDLDERD